MKRDILQRFLSRRLFDIGPDDAILDRLRRASRELGSSLLVNPTRSMYYVAVALDPHVPVDEPVLEEVSTFVEKQWNTYASRFADKPRTLLRAVLLEALRQAAGSNVGIAAAVSYSSRNLLPYLDLSTEGDVWLEVVEEADRLLIEKSNEAWSLDLDAQPPRPMLTNIGKPRTARRPKVDRDTLLASFNTAVGVGNPYAVVNNTQSWISQFASQATKAIADAIESASEEPTQPFIDNFAILLSGVEATLTDAIHSVSKGTLALRRRAELLWWKEALYSASARTSYRSLPPVAAAVLMASDLHHQVPAFSPESVDHFLHNAVTTVVGLKVVASPAKPLPRILADLVKTPGPVRDAIASQPRAEGRGPLIGLVADLLEGGQLGAGRLTGVVGVADTIKITLPDLAVWLFRDLQGLAAAATPVVPSESGPDEAKEEDEEEEE